MCSIASGVEGVLRPAGLDKSIGLISTAYAKDPFDPTWAGDPEVAAFLTWAKDYLTQAGPHDAVGGYITSWLIAYVLEKAGSNLTRAHILDVATHLTDVRADATAWHHRHDDAHGLQRDQ